MSDTVKLIIEMPKEDYEFTKDAETARVFPSEYYVNLILNGKPLDDVLGEIKAEIGWRNSAAYMGEYNAGLRDALKVINKCMEESKRGE